MPITWCKDCSESIFDYDGARPHKCPPAFLVWYEGHGDDPEVDHDVVHSHDAESAAEKWAEESDGQGDYTIVQGSDETVKVRPRDGGAWETWTVSGETVAQYSATKVKATP
ncbi:MAG: hypothetical protein O7G84_01065 [Gammaproteobacteria bacterium]|nr:hypothetical protein [Gammaproteobacteria bacterium]